MNGAAGARRRPFAVACVATMLAVAGAAVPLTLAPASRAQATTTVGATSTTTVGTTTTATTTTPANGTVLTPPAGLPYTQLTPYTATPPTRGALESDGQAGRWLLGGTWLYRADLSDAGIAQGWQAQSSTTGWQELTVPNAYNAGDLSSTSMNGYVGWYRRDFTVPAAAFAHTVPRAVQSWLVEFESVNYRATVWLNGRQIGTHTGAYLPFEFRLRGLRSGTNRLVVRVDDRRSYTDFPAGPGGGWWNYGGILDAVYLLPVAGAEIDSALIRPQLPCAHCAATVLEQPTIRNLSSRPQTVTLTGRYGAAAVRFGTATIRAGGTWTPAATVRIAHPRLWAPGQPNLYAATLTLADAHGHTLAGYSDESGIRTIKVDANGQLTLNGKVVHLRGVSLHEQALSTGAALSVAQQQQLIAWVRALGATVIRAHYPLDPELEEMADRDGILLWSEVPVYGSTMSSQQASTALASASYRNQAVALLRSNIAANEDHPSIMLWSIANELPTPATAGEALFIKQAAATAHALDPTRPVGMAVRDWPGVACQSAYAPLDVIGINEYFGWYDAGGGTTDDEQGLGPFLQSQRQCYPKQALIVSEFGNGADRAGPVEVLGTYAHQVSAISYHLGVMNAMPWLSGAIYFALQDFASEPGFDGGDPLGVPPWLDKGVIDQYGNLKPGFATLQSLFEATVQIGP